MNKCAIILGLKEFNLSLDEKRLLQEKKPLGVILFSRNIKNPSQTLGLTQSIKSILGKEAMILIDQEGGRVSRLNTNYWKNYPDANYFGKIANTNLAEAKSLTYENFKDIGSNLNKLGINYNCAPVLDLKIKGASSVIGSRAFSRSPEIVSHLALQACKGLLSENVFPIVKHIPGHGRAKVDSHFYLPIIKSSKKVLQEDFYPFIKLNKQPLAMIAHIKYLDLDREKCATYSKSIINFIKNKLGFEGILFSDDLCMKALKGSYINRARNAIKAGCDIVLHCEPNISNAVKSCDGAGYASKNLIKKIKELNTPN